MNPIPVKLLRELLPGKPQSIKKGVFSPVIFSPHLIYTQTNDMLVELTVDTGVPALVAVKADDVRKFLRPLSNKSDITVLVGSEGVNLVCHEGEVRISTIIPQILVPENLNLSVKQHNDRSFFSGKCCTNVPKDRLLSLLERLEPFVARDDFRPILNGIGLEHREENSEKSLPMGLKIVAVATDGHILGVENIGDMLTLFPGPGYSKSFPCPMVRLRTLIASADHTVRMQLWYDGVGNDWIEYSTPRWAITLKSLCNPNESYIDYSKTISGREPGPIGPEFDLMMSYVKVFARVSEAIKIDLGVPEQMVLWAYSSTLRDSTPEAKSIQHTNIKESFNKPLGFNASNVLKLGKFMQSDRIRLYCRSREGYESSTFRADGEERYCIIAPIRIHPPV